MFEFTPRPAAAHHAQEPSADTDVLDSPAWSALTGAHARFAVGDEYAKKYADDVSPFVGVVSWDEPRVWGSLIDLFGYNAEVALSHFTGELPSGWTEISRGDGVQLIASDRVTGEPYAEAVELDADDVEEMLAIVGRNRPGPFLPLTHELGRYVGVRREGRLVAMAGERLHADGFTEISAVSVDDDFRRQGLASALTLDIAYGIRQRGDVPFLHASGANTSAIATYEKLGFRLRRKVTFLRARTPERAS
ncbi:MAG: GNAT family N-acetyltransferase [Microbacterium gubbeenense]|uniref:GNAT family N-acetyltransferase n=1 Tax=Microbacterium gubbeenense TaxID=159896 RepID=UPI003F9B0D93